MITRGVNKGDGIPALRSHVCQSLHHESLKHNYYIGVNGQRLITKGLGANCFPKTHSSHTWPDCVVITSATDKHWLSLQHVILENPEQPRLAWPPVPAWNLFMVGYIISILAFPLPFHNITLECCGFTKNTHKFLDSNCPFSVCGLNGYNKRK